MKRFNNKWVLITGATSGFGKAIATSFAEEGAQLIIAGRRFARLKSLKNHLEQMHKTKVITYSFDIRNNEDVFKMADDLQKQNIVPDILINNAGLALGKEKIQEGLLSDWEQMIDTNIKGLLYVTRNILPMMIEKNSGHIINIGSTAGHTVYPNGNVYNATKFAVKALNEAINIDLVGTNIRCCSIDPGSAETEFSIVRFHGDKEKAKQVYEGYQALEAKDIADAVLYVCSTPAHVNIANMIIYPTAQRNVYVWHKEKQ